MRVRPCTLRMVCTNFMVWDDSLAKIHLGRRQEEQGWISDETRRMDDRVLWAKVRDIVRAAFNKERFEQIIAALRGAKTEVVPDVVMAVDAAVEFCGLPQASIEAIRNKFIAEKDFTRYGLLQAVTYQIHAAENDEQRDQFDDAGAMILASSMKEILS